MADNSDSIYKDIFDSFIEQCEKVWENESLDRLSNKRIFPIAQNQEFDDYLDDNNSKINIWWVEYSYSEVLYYTDNKSYWEQLEEYEVDKIDNLKKDILENYPTPIAILFDKYLKSSWNDKLMYLKDVNETIILILYSIVIAELIRLNIDLSDFHGIKWRIKQVFDWKMETKLSIMTWANNFFISNSWISPIESLYWTDTLSICEKLNKFRNDGFHNFTLEQDKAENLVRQKEPLLFELLFSINNIKDWKIFQVLTDCCSSVLQYSWLDTKTEIIEDLSGVSKESLYFNFEGINLKISPFLTYNFSNNMELCFFKQRNNETKKLKYWLLSEKIDIEWDTLWIFELDENIYLSDIYILEENLKEKIITPTSVETIKKQVEIQTQTNDIILDESETKIKSFISEFVANDTDLISKNLWTIIRDNQVVDWFKKDNIQSKIKIEIKRLFLKNKIDLEKIDSTLEFLIKLYS